MTDRPAGLQPERVVAWLEGQIEDKRHKRRAREIQKHFFAWARPHEAGFKQVSPLVVSGQKPLSDFETDRERAIAYVQERYTMGPIVTLLLWTVIKVIITRLVTRLFDLCLSDPDVLTVYYQSQGEPPHDINNNGRRPKDSGRNVSG